MFHGSESHYFGSREVWSRSYGFGSGGYYIDVRQCKGSDHFSEERGFLMIRFDQRQADRRGPELEGQGGEAGAGAYVEDSAVGSGRWAVVSTQCPVPSRSANSRSFASPPHRAKSGRAGGPGSLRMTNFFRAREKALGHKYGLAEVAGYYFFFSPDSGQIDAGVPAF